LSTTWIPTVEDLTGFAGVIITQPAVQPEWGNSQVFLGFLFLAEGPIQEFLIYAEHGLGTRRDKSLNQLAFLDLVISCY
jgi:hypothetical protein